ncbi:MAG TPA: tetratricopeptide repeat protein [Candidatus Obscuribacterales bacterium]
MTVTNKYLAVIFLIITLTGGAGLARDGAPPSVAKPCPCTAVEQVESKYKKLLAEAERAHGSSSKAVADLLLPLAVAYRNAGLYAKAEPLLDKALAIYRTPPGDEERAARVLIQLGSTYTATKKYDRAEATLKPVLAQAERNSGAQAPLAAEAWHELAKLHARRGRTKQAESAFQRAIEIREKHPGRGNSLLVSELRSLSELAIEQKRFARAEQLLRRQIALAEPTFGAKNWYVLGDTERLAWICQLQGKNKEAAQLFKRVLDARSRALGQESASLLWTLSHYAQVLGRLGRNSEAEAVVARIKKICNNGVAGPCFECVMRYGVVARASK